jgi:hypothetical protein
VLVPPEGRGRLLAVEYREHGWAEEQGAGHCDRAWSAVLDGIALRPADERSVASAARGAAPFPKEYQPGLAHRSLTLPQAGFQLALRRERWVAPDDFDTAAGVAVGITDRLELNAPGFVKYSFGEVEALTRPEFALAAGALGWEHDARRGSAWSFGASAQARRRLARDLAVRGSVAGWAHHESRTGRTRPGGAASTGVVWEALPLLAFGLEGGWSWRASDAPGRGTVWVGGRGTPLVTLQLPFVDLGLTGAVAWEGGGRPGLLAGMSLVLTL